MALSDYIPQSHKVETKGGSFDVKGLSLDDLGMLIKTHLKELDAVFDIAEKAGVGSLDVQEMRPLAMSLVSDAPGLAANIIALAAGEPNQAHNASLLPGPLQIEILLQIGRMTFEEVGGVKKAMGMLVDLLGALRPRPVAAQPASSQQA